MITLEVTNTDDINIIDNSDGLSLAEAIEIALNDPENSYIIEVPGGSTYNLTIPENFAVVGSITLLGTGDGAAIINGIRSGERVFRYEIGSGNTVSFFNNIPINENNNNNEVSPIIVEITNILEVTNTDDINIIDNSDGLSLAEAIEIALNDPENSYIIEVPGGSTYNATISEDIFGNINLRGTGDGNSSINIIRSGETVFQGEIGSGAFTSFNIGSPPRITIEDVVVSTRNEATEAEFAVRLVDSNGRAVSSSQTITVDFATEDESAIAGSDYTATSGTLTFAPGETEQTITVPLNPNLLEGERTFRVALNNADNASISDDRGTAIITDSLFYTPIYRFQNSDVPGTYLFVGPQERDNILANFPNFVEEGFAFRVGVEAGDDLIPLYRFQSNIVPGTYLFAGEQESNNIRENFSESFTEEGLAFYVYGAGDGLGTDFSRFQNSDRPGTYLFATGEERDNIRANFPNFMEEGLAFEAEL